MSERKCFEEDCIRHGTVDAGSCVVCQLLADAHAAGREAGMRVVPRQEPVAWRVKDFADGWILFTDEHEASRYAIKTGALMQALAAQEDSTSE